MEKILCVGSIPSPYSATVVFPFNKALGVVPEGQEAGVYERKADHAEQHFPVRVFHRQLSTPDLSQQSLSRAATGLLLLLLLWAYGLHELRRKIYMQYFRPQNNFEICINQIPSITKAIVCIKKIIIIIKLIKVIYVANIKTIKCNKFNKKNT